MNPPSQTPPNAAIFTESCNSGAIKYFGSESTGVPLAQLIGSLQPRDRLCWVLNAKSANLDLEQFDQLEIPDQLEPLDIEIKAQHSIHLIEHHQQSLHAQINQALGSDATSCVGITTNFATFQSQFATLAGWFLTPSALKLHIEEGSNFLLDQIFTAIGYVLIFEPKDRQWNLFLHPSDARIWQEIGLPQAPASQ